MTAVVLKVRSQASSTSIPWELVRITNSCIPAHIYGMRNWVGLVSMLFQSLLVILMHANVWEARTTAVPPVPCFSYFCSSHFLLPHASATLLQAILPLKLI